METLDIPNCEYASWNKFAKVYMNDELSFLNVNMFSLASKFDDFHALLSKLKHRITFIVITETWLKASNDFLLELEGYKSCNVYREESETGGGIKLFYREDVTVNQVEEYCGIHESCETLLIDAKIPNCGRIKVCALYRPPRRSLSSFFSFFDEMLTKCARHRCVFLGDFNLDMNLAEVNSYVRHYVELYTAYGFINVINKNTYVSPILERDKSCLDHLLHNLVQVKTRNFVLKPNLSDHYCTASLFDLRVSLKKVSVRFRDYSDANVQLYETMMNHEFESLLSIPEDVNEHAEYLVVFLKKLLNKYFPIKTKIYTDKRLKAPWITSEISKCIRKKFKWYRMYRKSLITRESYKKCCKDLRYILNLAKRKYYEKKFQSLGSNMRKNWKVLNKLMSKATSSTPDEFLIDGQAANDPQKIAETFCDYFINKPEGIHRDIGTSNGDYLEITERTSQSMVFFPITQSEVVRSIRALKKQGGLNDISRKFLKLSEREITPHLVTLFNKCVREGIYPNVLKLAKITPVYKKKERNLISNYRPVAVLTNLCKVFESIIFDRLSSFFQKKEILSQNQYGFRKHRSTELAVFTLLDRLLPALDDKLYSICVFLDFTACFDTISRSLLFKKLERYGVRDLVLSLIKSYFEGRKQYVNFKNFNSNAKLQKLGVIQGSKCGPLFYDIYANDISKLCGEKEYLMFADDTVLVYTGTNLNDLILQVNSRLDTIADWCKFNKLSLNSEKCKYMVVSNLDIPMKPIILINNTPIEEVSHFKYLGLQLDSSLKYNVHVNYLCGRLSQLCGMTYRLSSILNLESAKQVYFACVYSIVRYCICIWGGTLQFGHSTDRLCKIYKKCVENLFSKFVPPNCCVFKTVRILKLADIYKYNIGVYMFKIIKLQSCPTLQSNLRLEYPQYHYNTRHREEISTPFPRLNVSIMNYKYQCSKIWNSLPMSIRSASSLSDFKNKIKMHIFSGY